MGKGSFASLLAVALLVGGAAQPAARPGASALPLAAGRGDGRSAAAPKTTPSEPSEAPRAVPAERGAQPAAAFPYAPQAEWIPATNFDGMRNGSPIEFVVIHYTAISYERTLRAFRNPNSRVSSHYVVRGDGKVAQMVQEWDTAWHAGNYWYNERSVGIELELDGATNPAFTEQQYRAAAAIACGIARNWGVKLDRAHVIGHNEVPWPNDHTDPGPNWNWPHFMWLVSLCAPPADYNVRAAFVAESAFPEVAEGESSTVQVKLKNTGTTAWRKGTGQEARLAVRGNDKGFAFLSDGWPTPDRVADQDEDVVPPGGVATFTFRVKGTRPGTFTIPLRGVVDGGAWMDDEGVYVTVSVRPKEKEERGKDR